MMRKEAANLKECRKLLNFRCTEGEWLICWYHSARGSETATITIKPKESLKVRDMFTGTNDLLIHSVEKIK